MNMNDNFNYTFKVYHDDTDCAGVMYHGRYINYFERARTDFLHQKGLTHKHLESELKIIFAISKLDLHYKRPCRLEDELIIETNLNCIKGAKLDFEQIMFLNNYQENCCTNKKEIAIFHVEVITLNINWVPVVVPKEVRSLLS